VQLKGADLTSARLSGATLGASDLIAANFTGASLYKVDLTGSSLNRADCTGTDLRSVNFGNTVLAEATLVGVKLEGASLGATHLGNLDLGAFCKERNLKHGGPSYVDARAVMKTYPEPNLKQFLLDCGVPDIFAEYMVDCARALGEPLMRGLMQSTFISYGGPDEAFARKVYDCLRRHGVLTFFFPETARVGERLGNEVYRGVQDHDRVLLICSRDSLNRPGVVNEIQEALDREARDGGATYLLPVMLDDFVLTGWRASHPELAERLGRRIIADFRRAQGSRRAFNTGMNRVIDVLKKKRPDAALKT
jgi:hypothetical protein